MPSMTVHGVVIRFANYRDHDRMLTLLSPEHGKLEVLSRGCRRPKSALLPASELFVHGEFVLFHSNDRHTLTSCAIVDTFYPLRLDHERLTCASYMLGLCQAAVQPGENAEELYRLLLKGLYHLAYYPEEPPLSATAAFVLLFADAIGYRPRMNHCAQCRAALNTMEDGLLDIRSGGLVCPDCGARTAYRLKGEHIAWMREVLRSGFTQETQRKTDASELLSILRRYLESHLETPIKAGKLLP